MKDSALVAIAMFVASSAAAATESVSTVGLSFSPADVTIEVGDSVAWTIGMGHSVVQTDGPGSCTMEPGGFMSGSSEADTSVRSFTQTFTAAGVFTYKCNPHCGSGMRGSVTVVAPSDGAPVGNDGGMGDPGPSGDDNQPGDPGSTGDDTVTGGGDPGTSTGPTTNGTDDEGGCSTTGKNDMMPVAALVGLIALVRRKRI